VLRRLRSPKDLLQWFQEVFYHAPAEPGLSLEKKGKEGSTKTESIDVAGLKVYEAVCSVKQPLLFCRMIRSKINRF